MCKGYMVQAVDLHGKSTRGFSMYRLYELIKLTKISNIKLLENICFGNMFAEECDTSHSYLV